jgi:GT2 family glycosyltransferase
MGDDAGAGLMPMAAAKERPLSPPSPTAISYVVPLFQGQDPGAALDSIFGQRLPPADALVICNGVEPPFPAGRFPRARFLRLSKNIGFAGAAALGLARVQTPFAALINDDCRLPADWASRLLARMESEPRLAAAAGVTVTPAGRIQVAAVTFNGLWEAVESPDLLEQPLLNFTAVLLRMDAVRAVGGIEARFFAYYEDVDLCLRLKQRGFLLTVDPDLRVVHQGSQSAPTLGRRRAYLLLRNRQWTLLRNFGGSFYLKNWRKIRRADWKLLKTDPFLAVRIYPFLPWYPRIGCRF